MKFILCVIAAFILIAANPSLEQHQDRVRVVLAEKLEREATGWSGAITRFFRVPDFTAGMFALGVYRVNLLVCSFGMYDGEVVSFGALGCVIILF